jgi:hypothetical protein
MTIHLGSVIFASSALLLTACTARSTLPPAAPATAQAHQRAVKDDFSDCTGAGCFLTAPSTPNPVPEYINNAGQACDPSTAPYPDNCHYNASYGSDTSGTVGTPDANPNKYAAYQPQCLTVYGSVSRTAWHQCYNGYIWYS